LAKEEEELKSWKALCKTGKVLSDSQAHRDHSSQADPGPKTIYPYQSLVCEERLPDVDPARKEDHLSSGEFASVFGMPRGRFVLLPPWKRRMLKRGAGLL